MNRNALSDVIDGPADVVVDCFAVLSEKSRSVTRDGKPYFRIRFRDKHRSATAMIWNDSSWFAACRDDWTVGTVYKLRCRFCERPFGRQIDLERIRPMVESDDGVDVREFTLPSRCDPDRAFDRLMELVEKDVENAGLRTLTTDILSSQRESLVVVPASAKTHHMTSGGLLEHSLSVAENCLNVVSRYSEQYADLRPRLSKSLTVCGGALHDIGKIGSLGMRGFEVQQTSAGRLVGSTMLGRDIVRAHASNHDIDAETALRLEHIVIARFDPASDVDSVAPQTPEALIVAMCDALDSRFDVMASLLGTEDGGEFTARHPLLGQRVFRGTHSMAESAPSSLNGDDESGLVG